MNKKIILGIVIILIVLTIFLTVRGAGEGHEIGSHPSDDTTGNVLLLHLNNDSSVGESSTLAYDYSGQGHNGTLTNGPIWNCTNKKLGGCAIQLDGYNDYIEWGSELDSVLDGKSFTISTWIKTINSDWGFILCSRSSNGDEVRMTTDNFVYDDDNVGAVGAAPTTDISDNEWHHFVGTVDANNIKIYVDGVLEDTDDVSSSGTLATSNNKLYVGARYLHDTGGDYAAGHTNYLNAVLDEFAIYNRPLSAQEVKFQYTASSRSLEFYNFSSSGRSRPLEFNTYLDGEGHEIGSINADDITGNVLLMHLNNDGIYGDNGTNAYDYSGHGNNGTLVSAVNWDATDKKLGAASLDFVGVDDYVTIADSTDFVFPAGFTVSAWAKPDIADRSYRIVYSYDGVSDDGYFLTQSITGSGRWSFVAWVDNGYKILESTSAVTLDWHHIVGVREDDGSTLKLYVDGVLEDTDSRAGTIDVIGPVTLGIDHVGSNDYNGNIDEVAIYNRSLSATEVALLYNSGRLRPLEFYQT